MAIPVRDIFGCYRWPIRVRKTIRKWIRPRSKAILRPRPDEEPDLYRPGGFHPINLGTKSVGTDMRSYGRLAMVDTQPSGLHKITSMTTSFLAIKSKAHVALKVLRADVYGGRHEIFELEMLQHVSRVAKQSKHMGEAYVVRLQNHFHHNGPNGNHVCLAFNVLVHHLGFQVTKFKLGRIPVRIMKEVARQALLGLDFLHRERGIVHTDLQPMNILLELEDTEATIKEYLSKTPPRLLWQPGETPATMHAGCIKTPPGVPLREVINTPLISDMKNIHIRIVDLGVASWIDRHLSEEIQPQLLRTREVTIGAPWGTGVDIWSLDCLISQSMIEFVKGHVAFRPTISKTGAWTADDDRLAQLMEVFGPFPKSFLSKGTKTKQFFDDEGHLLRIPQLKPVSLEKLLDGDEGLLRRPDDMSSSEVPLFADFLRGMLALDPEDRKSAAEMLEHEWLRS